MTTATVTAQPGNGAIQLNIAPTGTVTAISRADNNGVADVRTLPGVLPYTPGLAVTRRNLVANPSFETGVNNWVGSRCTISRYSFNSPYWSSYVPGPSGAYGLRLDPDGTLGGTYAYSDTFDVTPGKYLAGSINASTAGGAFRLQLWFYDSSNSVIQSVTSALTGAGSSVYYLQPAAVSGIIPATAIYARVIVYFHTTTGGNPPTTQANYLERVIACMDSTQAAAEAAAANYFDGSTPPDANGAYSWSGTPHASYSIAKLPTTSLIVSDYEAASGDVSYTITVGNEADTTLGTTWDIGAPWLFVPVMPSYSVKLRTLLEYSAGGQSLGSVHQLLGREDPVAILRGMSSREGTLRLYCGTFAEARALVAATKRGEVLMLRQPEHDGMDMYFTATSYGIPTLEADGAETVFGVDLGYVELTRPPGDVSGSLGWTFAALASSQATFSALPKTYTTFQNMLLDQRK